MEKESVIVLDFGGQYNQLIARRVRECNVYCEIYSYKTDIEKIKAMNPKGIILTGGPNSCYEADSPTSPFCVLILQIPLHLNPSFLPLFYFYNPNKTLRISSLLSGFLLSGSLFELPTYFS